LLPTPTGDEPDYRVIGEAAARPWSVVTESSR